MFYTTSISMHKCWDMTQADGTLKELDGCSDGQSQHGWGPCTWKSGCLDFLLPCCIGLEFPER